jgi:hypothetical protein
VSDLYGTNLSSKRRPEQNMGPIMTQNPEVDLKRSVLMAETQTALRFSIFCMWSAIGRVCRQRADQVAAGWRFRVHLTLQTWGSLDEI